MRAGVRETAHHGKPHLGAFAFVVVIVGVPAVAAWLLVR